MLPNTERVLILTKTYPSPSSKYVETSCVAGVNENGEARRLFPVPFRLMDHNQQFKKWQWISVQVHKANNDHRPESYKLYTDSISCDPKPIPTSNAWRSRLVWLNRLQSASDFTELEETRKRSGNTLVVLKPFSVDSLEINRSKLSDWTPAELVKLTRDQLQTGLFDESQIRSQLKKVPFNFYYRYTCDSVGGKRQYCHKIVDWEVGALYWNCVKRYKEHWESKFRLKLERDLIKADLMFLMGTMHRFPSQWLIVGLIYPPKPAQNSIQGDLFQDVMS